MDSLFGEVVGRYCRIRSLTAADELSFPLDGDGFLDTSPEFLLDRGARDQIGRLVSLTDVLARHGAVVLLGEPGLGKTTELARLRWAGVEPVMVDGADITDTAAFDLLVGSHLQRRLTVEAPGSGSPLLLVVDQLDESPLRQHLAGHFDRVLRGHDTSNLRILVGCRTADLPPSLEDSLRKRCEGFVVADLAPLTRADAVRLACSVGVDGEALIAVAAASRVATWASVPLTLKLMVVAYDQRQTLALPPADLFGHGVLHLADEPDVTRSGQGYGSTPQQRLAVAERAAAWLLLSGRRTIWRGPALGAGEQDLDANKLVGDAEAVDNVAFEVTHERVREALSTGLFTGRGANRVAFRHGSFAAYLAARCLIRRGLPLSQLRQLLLIPAGGRATTIPVSLRETAAWLVALAPATAQWLVDADPESLIAHSALFDAAGTRQRIVEAMLQRAGEIEAGDQLWAHANLRLGHSDLESQLLDAIGKVGPEQPRSWEDQARVRLAVRFAAAADVPSPQLVDRLLQLADHDRWDASTRVLAASAALRASAETSSKSLGSLLHRLDDPVAAPDDPDPNSELRGTLLSLLWPKHLSTSDILGCLERPCPPNFFGAYRRFQRVFASTLPESDFARTLEWAAAALDEAAEAAQGGSTNDPEAGSGPDGDLLAQITDRVLSSPIANVHLRAVAAVLYGLAQRMDSHELPSAVDLVDASGAEPDDVRDLRRAVARALMERTVEVGQSGHASLVEVLDAWSPTRLGVTGGQDRDGLMRAGRRGLLDATDFAWLYAVSGDAASRGDGRLAAATAHAAASIFDLADIASAELAFRDQSHPVWLEVRWWFEPMAIDSEAATRWRNRRRRKPANDVPPTVDELHTAVRDAYAEVLAGDTNAFWRLAYDLQFDPKTTQPTVIPDPDLLGFPGVALLPEDHVGQLTNAALQYLRTEHDHGDEWVALGKQDKRAHAGYLALDLLQRRGRIDEVSGDRWSAWVNAIVSFDYFDSGSTAERNKQTLLTLAGHHAPREMAEAATAHVWSALRRGAAISSERAHVHATGELAGGFTDILSDIVAGIHGRDSTVRLGSSDQIAAAMTLFERMLPELLRAGDARARDLARSVLDADADTDEQLQLAGRAGRALLRTDASLHLPTLLQASRDRPHVGRALALALASWYDPRALVEALPVPQQEDIFRWYVELFPPSEDPPREAGFHFVSPTMQARELRDRVLDILTRAGTVEAADVLDRLTRDYPNHFAVRFYLGRARMAAATYGWKAPIPDHIRKLIDDSTRRFARNDLELRQIVLEVLFEVAAEIGKHGDLLWDRIPGQANAPDEWQPKLEYAIQAYLAHELDLRLVRRGIIVNREVQVRPTDATSGAGDRVDILVQVLGPEGIAHNLATVIEIKGPWNDKVLTAQREQLVGYLQAVNTTAGIYLVSWYELEKWRTGDWKRQRTNRHDRETLRVALGEQSEAIRSETGHDITSIVFDIALPARPRSTGLSLGEAVPSGRSLTAPGLIA